MWARCVLLHGILLNMHLHCDTICIAELRRMASPASYVSFVIKCSAIHQYMGPGSWGNTCWQRAHIAQLNELTDSEVTELTTSTGDETALAILKRQESRGITLVGSQSKFIFDIYISSIFTTLTDKAL